MNSKENALLKAIIAGMYIGIAGLVYLSLDNHIVGALLLVLDYLLL